MTHSYIMPTDMQLRKKMSNCFCSWSAFTKL